MRKGRVCQVGEGWFCRGVLLLYRMSAVSSSVLVYGCVLRSDESLREELVGPQRTSVNDRKAVVGLPVLSCSAMVQVEAKLSCGSRKVSKAADTEENAQEAVNGKEKIREAVM